MEKVFGDMNAKEVKKMEKIADEVVFINGGKVLLSGNKDSILTNHGNMSSLEEIMLFYVNKFI